MDVLLAYFLFIACISGAFKNQKRVLGPLQLELQVFLSCM